MFFGPTTWSLFEMASKLVTLSQDEIVLGTGWQFCRNEWLAIHHTYADTATRLDLLTADQWNELDRNLNFDVGQWPAEIAIELDRTDEELQSLAMSLLATRETGH